MSSLKKVVEKDPRKYMPKNYFYENLALWCEEHGGFLPPQKNYVGKKSAWYSSRCQRKKKNAWWKTKTMLGWYRLEGIPPEVERMR